MLFFYPRAIGPSWQKLLLLLIVLTTINNSLIMVGARAGGNDGKNTTINTTIITLRAGVLLNDPYAYVTGNDSLQWIEAWGAGYDSNKTTNLFSGFQIDLLDYMKELAKQQGYTLNVQLELAPQQNYLAALDLVANDCNTTSNPILLDNCQKYDLIIGDYYVNEERRMRVDFSPPLVKTSMSTIKVVRKDDDNSTAPNFSTLSKLEEGGGTVCLPIGTYISEVVVERIPDANVNLCEGLFDCLETLKNGDCGLYVDDELALRYQAIIDKDLVMPGEFFSTQYVVWPMRYNLPETTRMLFEKWMYAAIADSYLDDLYYKYFEEAVKICPLGKSGVECDQDCDPEHGRSNQKEEQLCQCHSTKWIGDDCSKEVLEELNLIPKQLILAGYIMFAINIVACMVCAVWLRWQRKSQYVRVSQPLFLYLVLLGCTVSTTTIVLMAQEHADNGPIIACAFLPWFYGIGFSITFGTLFAKILRVYRLFKNAAQMTRIKITAFDAFKEICAITSVDVIICFVWTLIDPMQWTREVLTRDKFEVPLSSQGYCSSTYWNEFTITICCWHFLLLGMALYLCYVSRNISSQYAEVKPLALVMVSQFQIFLISIPVLIIVRNNPASSFFVRSVVIWLNDFGVILIIFGNLMYSVHWNKTENLDIGEAVKSFSTKQKKAENSGFMTSGTSTEFSIQILLGI
mmetsp:Transcript_39979/g.45097  ORF Transcript_39979/g.45097 Transcript_39979/m.45097 type:complete len:686 (+) Transcript_39979:188-2245(+)